MADQKITELDAKATPADTDLVPIVDIVADPDQTKKVTWANVKATLKTYFDTLYALLAHKDSHDPEDGGDPLDCAAASEIAGVQAAAEGSAHTFARSDHAHQIQHGIADNHLLTVDGTINNGEYLKATANGAEGKTFAEVITDLQNNINKIVDPTDQDTLVEAEEDQVTMDVAGVEAFLLSSVGILTLAKQPAFRAYQTTAQSIQDSVVTRVRFDTEDFDVQSELDITQKTGTADENPQTANHLTDDTNSQFSSADVGREVWNTTDNTYATVTGYNDAGDLTLDADIMDFGENYELFDSRYTATVAGKCAVCVAGSLQSMTDQDFIMATVYDDTGGVGISARSYVSYHQAVTGATSAADIIDLAANDSIWMVIYWSGANDTYSTSNQKHHTYFSLAKVS